MSTGPKEIFWRGKSRINYLIRRKRHEEISQVKMFNTNLLKNKSYYMNFKHKNMSYMPL